MTQSQYKLRVALEELESNNWQTLSSEDEFVEQFREKVKKRKAAKKSADPIQEAQQKILENITTKKEEKSTNE